MHSLVASLRRTVTVVWMMLRWIGLRMSQIIVDEWQSNERLELVSSPRGEGSFRADVAEAKSWVVDGSCSFAATDQGPNVA